MDSDVRGLALTWEKLIWMLVYLPNEAPRPPRLWKRTSRQEREKRQIEGSRFKHSGFDYLCSPLRACSRTSWSPSLRSENTNTSRYRFRTEQISMWRKKKKKNKVPHWEAKEMSHSFVWQIYELNKLEPHDHKHLSVTACCYCHWR